MVQFRARRKMQTVQESAGQCRKKQENAEK
jgi:hypothetical protein